MKKKEPIIKDSGNRRDFPTGARRDRASGKGLPTLISPIFAQTFIKYNKGAVKDCPTMTNYRHCLLAAISGTFRLLEGIIDTDLEYAIASDIMGAMKLQNTPDKPFAEIYPIFFQKLAKQLELGAEKYGERNWEKGMPLIEYLNSLLRHLLQWYDGDEDEPHDAAAAFNIMCYCHTRLMIKLKKLPMSLSYMPDFTNHNGCKMYDMDGNEYESPDPHHAAHANKNMDRLLRGVGGMV